MSCGRQSGESLKSESGNHLRKELRVLNETGPEAWEPKQFWVEGGNVSKSLREFAIEMGTTIAASFLIPEVGRPGWPERSQTNLESILTGVAVARRTNHSCTDMIR